MANAIVDPVTGNSLILESDGSIFTLNHDHEAPKTAKGLNVGMYMQGFVTQEERDAGDFPYVELHQYLRDSQENHVGLRAFIYCTDESFSGDIRVELFEEFEKQLGNQKVREYVLTRVGETPLNKRNLVGSRLESFPTTGNIGAFVEAVKERWERK